MAAALQAVRGMNDVLPDEAALWQRFEDTARSVFERYGYRNLRVPIVEPTPLFVRGIGEHTDVVEKEMYTFEDKLNGEQPDAASRRRPPASCARRSSTASIYERPQRVWTGGPMFRHERPQKGRYRQFHQLDVEALGFAGPDVDAEQIVMLARLWRALGLAGITLAINSIGDAGERRAHRDGADRAFRAARGRCSTTTRSAALHANPLRILDSKNPALQDDHRRRAAARSTRSARESRAHFDALRALLDEAGIAYAVNPRLVRGLDYYNRTVFEWVTDALGAQGTVAGGGRYDGLFEALGGKPTPACGFAIGVERMILLLQAQGSAARGGARSLRRARRRARPAQVARRVAETLRDHGACGRAARGRRQLQVADEEGRRERRAPRADRRRRRGGGGHRRDQDAARTAASRSSVPRRTICVGALRRTEHFQGRIWLSMTWKSRTRSTI